MFCNSCGTQYEHDESKARYFCDDCRRSKAWPINRVYCALCGKELGRKLVRRQILGLDSVTSIREGHFFCRACREAKRPKYNQSQFDVDALIDIEKPSKVVVELAYRRYVPVKDVVVVVYECACDTPNKINHHYDYARPLEVVRLCKSCHRKEHSRLAKLRALTSIQTDQTTEIIV